MGLWGYSSWMSRFVLEEVCGASLEEFLVKWLEEVLVLGGFLEGMLEGMCEPEV